jgi:hypothetical protein
MAHAAAASADLPPSAPPPQVYHINGAGADAGVVYSEMQAATAAWIHLTNLGPSAWQAP